MARRNMLVIRNYEDDEQTLKLMVIWDAMEIYMMPSKSMFVDAKRHCCALYIYSFDWYYINYLPQFLNAWCTCSIDQLYLQCIIYSLYIFHIAESDTTLSRKLDHCIIECLSRSQMDVCPRNLERYPPRRCRPYKWSISILLRSQCKKKMTTTS